MIYMTRPVRWNELTDEQRARFGNGCGSGWLSRLFARIAFGWFFEASCRRHDFAYTRGGDELDRADADEGFYKAMMRDADRLPGAKRIAAKVVGKAFYGLVAIFGFMFFHYGEYRTLRKIMEINDARKN